MKTTTKQKAEDYSSSLMNEILNQISPEEQKRTDDRMMLAAKIFNALKLKGWKQKDLALALNKRPSEITKWLSGTHNFTTDTLWDIEEVLDVKLILLEDQEKEILMQFNIISVTNKSQEYENITFYDCCYGKNIVIKQHTELVQPNKSYQA